jgi:hypothetical protein
MENLHGVHNHRIILVREVGQEVGQEVDLVVVQVADLAVVLTQLLSVQAAQPLARLR